MEYMEHKKIVSKMNYYLKRSKRIGSERYLVSCESNITILTSTFKTSVIIHTTKKEGKERKNEQIWCNLSLTKHRVASGSDRIKIWCLKERKEQQRLPNTYNNNISKEEVWSLCELPKNRLAAGYLSPYFKVWDLERGECEMKISGESLSPIVYFLLHSGGLFLTACDEPYIECWDLDELLNVSSNRGNVGVEYRKEKLVTSEGSCPKIIEDKGMVYAVSWDIEHPVWIWKGNPNPKTPNSASGFSPPLSLSQTILPKVQQVSIELYGEGYLATGGQNGYISLWDLTTHSELFKRKCAQGYISCMELLGTGDVHTGRLFLLFGSYDGLFGILDPWNNNLKLIIHFPNGIHDLDTIHY